MHMGRILSGVSCILLAWISWLHYWCYSGSAPVQLPSSHLASIRVEVTSLQDLALVLHKRPFSVIISDICMI